MLAQYGVIALIFLLSAIWVGLTFLLSPDRDSREPPVLGSSIPFIGHILGLLRHGTRYYEQTRYYTSDDWCLN